MKIPNSRIVGDATNNSSFVRMEPAYYAAFYRRVWGIRMAQNNLKIEPLDEGTHADARYHEIDSIEAEARLLRAKFGTEMFDMVFPAGTDDLRIAVEREIVKDIERAKKTRETAKIPHASFMAFGLPTFECPTEPTLVDTEAIRRDKLEGIDKYNKEAVKLALALQNAGFQTVESCAGADIIKLCEAGVSPSVALRLSTPTEVTNDALAHANAVGSP
jgi:hypothetical protein